MKGVAAARKLEFLLMYSSAARDGAAIIFVSYDFEETSSIRDRIVIMTEGDFYLTYGESI